MEQVKAEPRSKPLANAVSSWLARAAPSLLAPADPSRKLSAVFCRNHWLFLISKVQI